MKAFFKIFLLLLVIFPLWLTIAALAEEAPALDVWQQKINQELLKLENRKVQVAELMRMDEELHPSFLTEKFEVDLSKLQRGSISRLSLKFKNETGELTKVVAFTAKMSVQERVPVFTRPLSRGSQVAEGDLVMAWVDQSLVPKDVSTLDAAMKRRLKNAVNTGDVAHESDFEQETLVGKGDRVRILVNSNGIRLTAIGVAKESGIRGQTIRVVNIDSKKEILAVIRDPKNVEVNL